MLSPDSSQWTGNWVKCILLRVSEAAHGRTQGHSAKWHGKNAVCLPPLASPLSAHTMPSKCLAPSGTEFLNLEIDIKRCPPYRVLWGSNN